MAGVGMATVAKDMPAMIVIIVILVMPILATGIVRMTFTKLAATR